MVEMKIALETDGTAVVENSAGGALDRKSFAEAVDNVGAGSMLGYRLEQQAALSNFGMEALRSNGVEHLLNCAVDTAAKGMRASLAKILEYRKPTNDLLIRAGVGWRPGVVGKVSFGADVESPAGYAFHTGSPVISNHLEGEKQFRTPALMVEHGVRRAINVLISFNGGRWGVLEVDSSSAGEFEAADLAFLQGLANFIGVALDRQVAEDRLSDALNYQKLLVQEASHRVKNSLAILSSLLQMKARSSRTSAEAEALGGASDRIIAMARTHDQLWRQAGGDTLDLGALIEDVCKTLSNQLDLIEIQCDAESIDVLPGQAVSFALLLTELITNSAKHAYGGRGGVVHVRLAYQGTARLLEVRDEGVGFGGGTPPAADGARGSLGMHLIDILTKDLGGTFEIVAGRGAIVQIHF